MNKRLSGMRGTLALLAALAVGLLWAPEASAGGHGSRGGRAPRPPRVSMPRGGFSMPRMPRAAAPARTNQARTRGQSNYTTSHSNHTTSRSNLASGTRQSRAMAFRNAPSSSRAGLTAATATGAPTTTGRGLTGTANSTSSPGTATTSSGAPLPGTYTYGSGNNARGYRAYGYGRGYRNTYYGRRYGYGRSQGNNRAIIARLRAVHMSLARVNHDYQGHRVQAMHQITMAIRQLSHRSMNYGGGSGFAAGMNNGRGMGMRGGGGGLGGGAGGRRGGGLMNQAQSDGIMSQALRTLQGIGMQLTSQGTNTMGHARASGHVQVAIRELNTALSIR